MPGNPIRRQRMLQLDKIGEEDIFRRIAEGETLGSVCKHAGVARRMFYFWLDEAEGRREAYEQAKRISAGAHAERAGDAIEGAARNPGLLPVHVQLARESVDYHKWLAGCYDPQTFGQGRNGQGGDVVVNIGSLHLEALRAAQAPPEKRIEEPPEEADWEEVDEDPDPAA